MKCVNCSHVLTQLRCFSLCTLMRVTHFNNTLIEGARLHTGSLHPSSKHRPRLNEDGGVVCCTALVPASEASGESCGCIEGDPQRVRHVVRPRSRSMRHGESAD